jgi:hypothetical protein
MGVKGRRLLSAVLALAAVATALAGTFVTLFLVGRRAEDYCEDVGGPCSDAAPVRVILLGVVALLSLAALGMLAWRLLSHAAEPRPQELRRPLLRALAACFAWLVVACSLLVDISY